MRVEEIAHMRDDALQSGRRIKPDHGAGQARPLGQSGDRHLIERAVALEARIGCGVHVHDEVGDGAIDAKRERFSLNQAVGLGLRADEGLGRLGVEILVDRNGAPVLRRRGCQQGRGFACRRWTRSAAVDAVADDQAPLDH
jgi:hypothetical protein